MPMNKVKGTKYKKARVGAGKSSMRKGTKAKKSSMSKVYRGMHGAGGKKAGKKMKY